MYYDDEYYGKIVYSYDSLQNLNGTTNLNGYYYPIATENRGPIMKWEYDSANASEYGYYLNHLGEYTTTTNGDAAYRRFFDEESNCVRLELYDLEGDLFEPTYQTAIIKYEYDQNNNKIKTSYFTSDNRPSPAKQGAHINTYIYSKAGYLLERAYKDTAQQLIAFNGFAKIKWKYDSLGNEIEVNYYNSNDKLIDSTAAMVRYKYDQAGNIIEEMDLDQNATISVIRQKEYSRENQLSSLSYFNDNRSRISDSVGVHRYEYYFDDIYPKGFAYYNVNDERVEVKGIAYSIYDLDNRGNIVAELNYNKKGELSRGEDNDYAIKVSLYDAYDRVIKEHFFDEEEQATLINVAYSTIKYQLDQSGNCLWQGFFDPDGSLVENEEGVALIEQYFNRNSNLEYSHEYKLEDAIPLEEKIDWLSTYHEKKE